MLISAFSSKHYWAKERPHRAAGVDNLNFSLSNSISLWALITKATSVKRSGIKSNSKCWLPPTGDYVIISYSVWHSSLVHCLRSWPLVRCLRSWPLVQCLRSWLAWVWHTYRKGVSSQCEGWRLAVLTETVWYSHPTQPQAKVTMSLGQHKHSCILIKIYKSRRGRKKHQYPEHQKSKHFFNE